jgi:hypothetical protein
MTTVFKPWNTGLGDQIATINLLSRRSAATGKPVYLSRLQNGQDLGRLHDEILGILAAPAPVISVPEPGNTDLSGFDVWAGEFYPSYVTWQTLAPHGYVSMHFDGVSSAADKNPPPEDIRAMWNVGEPYGLHRVELGRKMDLMTCVRALQSSAFFVGVDSGFSHLAHMVGVPVFLLQYRLPVVTCHRGKPYILCEGAQDFAIKLGRWVDYRRFIGAGL